MSIQRHYDGKELSSLYINGDELKELLELINEVIMSNYTTEYGNKLKAAYPNVYPIIDDICQEIYE